MMRDMDLKGILIRIFGVMMKYKLQALAVYIFFGIIENNYLKQRERRSGSPNRQNLSSKSGTADTRECVWN